MDYVSSTLSAFNVNEDTLPLTFTVIIDDSKVVDIILAPIKESCLANHSYKSHKGIFAATKTYYLTVKSLGKHTIYEYNSSFGVLSSSCSDYTTSTACSGCGDASGESYMCKWDTDSGTCKTGSVPCPTPGPGPSPSKEYGYNACKNYITKTSGLKKNIDDNKVTALDIATIWILATGDMSGAKRNTISGCGLNSGGCKDLCIAAVTQALGECQAFNNPINMNTGGCKLYANSRNDGGFWQVSNYNTDKIKDIDPCNTITALSTDPCCSARGAWTHASSNCTTPTFSDGTEIPSCPIYIPDSENMWNHLLTSGDSVHNPCWNGPFCVRAQDDDWGTDTSKKPKEYSCDSITKKELCKPAECKWYDNQNICLGGFTGWTDSWSKYAYSRCCSDKTGCNSKTISTSYGCFNLGQKNALVKAHTFASISDIKGLGKPYLGIAQDACTQALKDLNIKST